MDASRSRPERRSTPERWYEPAATVPAAPVQEGPVKGGGGTNRGIGYDPRRGAVGRGPRVGWHRGRPRRVRRTRQADRDDHHHPDRYHGRRHESAGHDRRVVGHGRRRREGQPGRRSDHRRVATSTRRRASIPETGVGSGLIYDAAWLDPDQPSRRRGQRPTPGRAQRWPRVRGPRLWHRHADRPRDRQDRCERPPGREHRPIERAQGRASWSSRSAAPSEPTPTPSRAASSRPRAARSRPTATRA